MTLLFTAALSAQNPSAPLINFEMTEASGGVIKDLTGTATITPGAKASVVSNGPLELKALKFDGTIHGTAKLDLGKAKEKLDGFEMSYSFWVRFDSIQKQGGEITGNDTGLGLTLNPDRKFWFGLPITGPNQLGMPGVTQLELGKWHHIAFTYSIDKEEAKLYLDGDLHQALTGTELFPLKINWPEIGKFNGAIASLKIWDRALTEEEITMVKPDDNAIKFLREKLAVLDNAEGIEFQSFRDSLANEIRNLKNSPTVSVRSINALMKKINAAVRLKPAAKALAATSLAKAPFALLAIQAVSPEIRVPESFPPDAEFTANLRVAAAKGEFEPVSFIIQPYKNIEKFELVPGDFKGDGGTIPASAIDIKVVKCWYQANWNSYFNSSNQMLVPDLLLNDENLVKVDEVKRKNYLKIDYPSGTKYCDVNFTGTFENVKPFNYCLEPVRDAKKFTSAKLVPGRGTQFWLTVHVPKDAKPGLYASKIKTVCDGAATGEITFNLRVFPFELPVAKTSYNLNEEYLTFIIGEANLANYTSLTKNIDEAERILRKDYKNMTDHNLRHLGGPAYSAGDSAEEIFTREVKLRKDAGFPLKPIISGGAADDFGYNLYLRHNKETPEKTKESMDAFKKRIDASIAMTEKLLGHKDIYYYAIDEATGADTMRFMAMYRDYIFSKGTRVISSGWGNNYMFMPSMETMHAEAAIIDKEIADRWHAIKGKLISYAGPFAGPDNPDLMRRSHGMRMYRANYDGFFMLSYVEALHSWNERVRGTYRNFSMAYPTVEGPVNSIAFEGLREGLDDIRYATLMRQLAEECFASKDLQAIYAAKKAIAWFELTDPASINLDLLRLEMADHIMQMMERLGRKVK